MITRIEIDGFKTFDNFRLDLRPFTAVVGPNASGKSNLFDAIKFISRLAQTDIREAMQELRGRPEELFRRTAAKRSDRMAFAVEVLLEPHGTDPFGKSFELRTQRIRYELEIAIRTGADRRLEGVYVHREHCLPIRLKEERGSIAWNSRSVRYGQQSKPFIAMRSGSSEESHVIEIRQDGPGKRGRPLALSAREASRTGLSTVTTAEFPHLYALRTLLSSTQFLQIDPQASRRSYFEVLVPRVIESTVLKVGKTPVDVPERPSLRLGRKGRSVDAVAREACDGREAFHVVFVHADTGGRGQQARLPERSTAYCMRMHEECELRRERCVLLRPASMMESWALADPQAVLDALGYRGAPAELGLPVGAEQAEGHPDPKGCLHSAFRTVRGPRGARGDTLLPAIAQRQSIDALRRLRSFQELERSLHTALGELGVLET